MAIYGRPGRLSPPPRAPVGLLIGLGPHPAVDGEAGVPLTQLAQTGSGKAELRCMKRANPAENGWTQLRASAELEEPSHKNRRIMS